MEKDKDEKKFTGELKATNIFGLEFKEHFSPSESLEGMGERMDSRIKKVRKIKQNNIFNGQFHAYHNNEE